MNTIIILIGGIGGAEIFLIFLVVLLLFGSKKIPDFARSLGKGMREFRKATEEIKKEIKDSTQEVRKDVDDINKNLQG